MMAENLSPQKAKLLAMLALQGGVRDGLIMMGPTRLSRPASALSPGTPDSRDS